jgi:hypothetical protein
MTFPEPVPSAGEGEADCAPDSDWPEPCAVTAAPAPAPVGLKSEKNPSPYSPPPGAAVLAGGRWPEGWRAAGGAVCTTWRRRSSSSSSKERVRPRHRASASVREGRRAGGQGEEQGRAHLAGHSGGSGRRCAACCWAAHALPVRSRVRSRSALCMLRLGLLLLLLELLLSQNCLDMHMKPKVRGWRQQLGLI